MPPSEVGSGWWIPSGGETVVGPRWENFVGSANAAVAVRENFVGLESVAGTWQENFVGLVNVAGGSSGSSVERVVVLE